MAPWPRSAAPLAALACIFACGCAGPAGPAPSEVHYTRNEVELYGGLEHDAPVLQVLDFDTPVTILERHRSYARIRTADEAQGWLDASLLLDGTLRRQLRALTNRATGIRNQGVSRARDTLNVHTEPYRWAPTFYQLDKDQAVHILDRALVDRLPASAAEGGPSEPTGEDYWYLVRVPGINEVGWLLANMAYADIPLEVAMLAQGRSIVAFFEIGATDDESLAVSKPTWLWFQSSGRGQVHDFDRLSVFQWDPRRDRYIVIRQVSDLTGYLPVEIVPRMETERGTATGFRVLIERDGEMRDRAYAYAGRRVYQLDETPVAGVPPRAPPGGFGRR